ncbi:MAG TPA: hypothetical protein VJA46_13770 [Acidimicrobiia bacterium]|nr:hypothetical protein [Acidimicrobiia bacterium]
MTITAARPAAIGAPPSPMSIVLSLARFEGRKTVTHPLVWVGALGAAGMAIFELREQAPVLNRVSVTLAWTMLPLAAAVALVAGWAALRARGRTDAHPPVILPVAISQRVGGIVTGLLWPALGTLLLQMVLLGWVSTRDPVTSLVWTELLVGPVYIIFAGALGAALTRWLPHTATPLFAVLGLGALMVAFPYDQSKWGLSIGPEWLMPLAWPQDIIPYEVAFRPAGRHLLYVASLVLVLSGLAVLGRARLGWAVLAFGLVGAVMSGSSQLGPIPENQRVEAMNRLVGDTAELTCETHSGVRYCAMPGYEAWIKHWAQVTEPVLNAAPTAAVTGIEIRQYPVHNTFLLDGDDQTYNDWWWFTPTYEDYAERGAVAVGSMLAEWEGVSWVAGLGPTIVGCEPWKDCPGEAQRVAVTWLLVQYPRVQSYTVNDPTWGTEHASVADCMIKELWAKSDAASIVLDNWDQLTALETTYEEAGAILGVSVPTGYDQNGILVGGCP